MALEQSGRGQCLCGAVSFKAYGTLEGVALCHCSQCRRWHGNAGAYARAEKIDISGADHVNWFPSSDKAERGFCSRCGSTLFWRSLDREYPDFTAGCLDVPTGMKIIGHYYVADASDYELLADDLPKFKASSQS